MTVALSGLRKLARVSFALRHAGVKRDRSGNCVAEYSYGGE
jgi:hypothetical protein